MQQFEYRVVPAPRRGEKTRTARTTPDRFAATLTTLMNDLAADGWEYIRADTLPCEERVGLTGRTTTFQNMLVFRRALSVPKPEAAVTPLQPAAARAAALKPAERLMTDYPARTPALFRRLTADAPTGEAPRITLVPPVPETIATVGPASGNGLAKS